MVDFHPQYYYSLSTNIPWQCYQMLDSHWNSDVNASALLGKEAIDGAKQKEQATEQLTVVQGANNS